MSDHLLKLGRPSRAPLTLATINSASIQQRARRKFSTPRPVVRVSRRWRGDVVGPTGLEPMTSTVEFGRFAPVIPIFGDGDGDELAA